MKEVIGVYQNGNYRLTFLSDGTKIRFTEEDEFLPVRPESMDVKLTNMCDGGCQYCHEASTPDGKHGDIINDNFFLTMKPYTEIAIGGGNVLEYPDLVKVLEMCKERKIIVSMTVNQDHFMKNREFLGELRDRKLIYGLGISLVYPTDEFINSVREFPNAVVHVIAGIVSRTVLEKLYDRGLKMLILGYKKFRKGNTYYKSSVDAQVRIDSGINWLRDNIKEVITHFDVVSFDNLSIQQLDIQSIMDDKDWIDFYMGGEGEFTMYVDTVNKQFGTSSTAKKRYDYTNETAEEMFTIIRKENGYVVNSRT